MEPREDDQSGHPKGEKRISDPEFARDNVLRAILAKPSIGRRFRQQVDAIYQQAIVLGEELMGVLNSSPESRLEELESKLDKLSDERDSQLRADFARLESQVASRIAENKEGISNHEGDRVRLEQIAEDDPNLRKFINEHYELFIDVINADSESYRGLIRGIIEGVRDNQKEFHKIRRRSRRSLFTLHFIWGFLIFTLAIELAMEIAREPFKERLLFSLGLALAMSLIAWLCEEYLINPKLEKFLLERRQRNLAINLHKFCDLQIKSLTYVAYVDIEPPRATGVMPPGPPG